MSARWIKRLALTATAATWVPPVVAGARWPDYSAPRDYISELGATGAPDRAWVNVTFVAAGLLIVALCVALARARSGLRVPCALVAAAGASYIAAAWFPCDAGCPVQGSPTQAVHNTAGALGYLAAGVGLLMAARPVAAGGSPALARLAGGAGVAVLAGLTALGAPELGAVRGLAQRLVELGIFAWLMMVAWTLPATSASSGRRPTSDPA